MKALLYGALGSMASVLVACGVHVSGGGGGGGGGGSACPGPSPGMCPPQLTCVDGLQRTGEATCQGGQWVCTQAACDGGAGGCNGSMDQVCSGGHLQAFCCPNGAPCAASIFCDLGGGACIDGVTCAELDGGAPCPNGSMDATQYDQSCTGAADCAPVYQGSLCADCFCPNAAVNQGALAAYQSDFAAKNPPTNVCDCPLIPPPVCQGGVCSLPSPP